MLLSTLRTRGHRLAICTNKPEAPTRAILRHFNLAEFFPVIVGGDTLPHRKPDPAPLRLAMSHLATQSFWFIGDSEVDAETAKAAKVRLALFTGGYRNTAAQDLGAEVIFDNHTQLLDVLIQRLPDFG